MKRTLSKIFFIILSASNLVAPFAPAFGEEDTYLNSIWRSELEPTITLAPPSCRDISGLQQKSSSYKLCLPSSMVDKIKITTSGSAARLEGPGVIQGPILVKSNPPMFILGSMKINQGGFELTIKNSGGYTMNGLGKVFEIEGLIFPILASKPLEITDVELRFSSSEDALLQIRASNQKTAVVLRVEKKGESELLFIPSPNNFSIFPQNAFFSEFKGRFQSKGSNRILKITLKDGSEVSLQEGREEDE